MRGRFAARKIAGLADEKVTGRLKTVDDAATAAATLEPPLASLG